MGGGNGGFGSTGHRTRLMFHGLLRSFTFLGAWAVALQGKIALEVTLYEPLASQTRNRAYPSKLT